MYVCICNAVRESEVQQAVEHGGASSPSEVYGCLGVSPRCGRCAETICALLDRFEPVTSPVAA